MKILVVEDDAALAQFIVNGFRERGHQVELAHDGYDGLALAMEGAFDVLVFDRMIPKLDGLTLLRTIRNSGVNTPVLFLTAMGNLEDRIEGFEAGGDDYLIKPFAFAELYARVCSLGRRKIAEPRSTILTVKDIRMDVSKRTLTRGPKSISLQPTEFKILEYLLRNAGKVVTRTMLLEHVWDFNFDPKTSVIETHISRLRQKLDSGFDEELIQTVRGAGYIVHAN